MPSCSFPPPLTSDQLSAALDGPAAPQVAAHLARCAGCAARLESARQAELALRQQLFRWDCPSPQLLGDYHTGLLTQFESANISAHIEACALCARELQDLRLFMSSSDQPQSESQPRPQTRSAGLGEWVAQLLPRSLSPALRGEAGAPLTAEAPGLTVVLDFQPTLDGKITIQGQAAALDQDQWTGGLVTLHQAGQLVSSAAIDDLGSFRLEGLPPGRAELRLTPTSGRPVVLRDIELAV